jgi:hypothetical protein
MENFVISAQIRGLNQVFLKSLTFFSQKTIGVANDSKNITTESNRIKGLVTNLLIRNEILTFLRDNF